MLGFPSTGFEPVMIDPADPSCLLFFQETDVLIEPMQLPTGLEPIEQAVAPAERREQASNDPSFNLQLETAGVWMATGIFACSTVELPRGESQGVELNHRLALRRG